MELSSISDRIDSAKIQANERVELSDLKGTLEEERFKSSSLVTGEGLERESAGKITVVRTEIHQENVSKLNAMSEKEILERKARIESSLGNTKVYSDFVAILEQEISEKSINSFEIE